jgi:hypothetical protein
MAEETLVKEMLTDEMKKAGAELTRKLDEAKWPVTASFWYFVSDDNQWKLIVASPKLESEGPNSDLTRTIHEPLRFAAKCQPSSRAGEARRRISSYVD